MAKVDAFCPTLGWLDRSEVSGLQRSEYEPGNSARKIVPLSFVPGLQEPQIQYELRVDNRVVAFVVNPIIQDCERRTAALTFDRRGIRRGGLVVGAQDFDRNLISQVGHMRIVSRHPSFGFDFFLDFYLSVTKAGD